MDLITALTAAGGASAGGAADPNFNQTVLLLHGDGTNGAQNNTFLDSSSNTFTITRNGNTTQGSFSPFSADEGEWSNYFDGSGDYLTTPDSVDFTMGSGNFSLECWYYPTSSSRQGLIGQSNAAGQTSTISFWLEKNASNQLYILVGSGGTPYQATSTTTIPLNTWSFIQMIRDGNTLAGYINGTQVCSVSVTGVSINDASDVVSIGGGTVSLPVSGYISNVRILKGVAASTTVPTTPPTSDANTSLLTCQSNRFVDKSGTPKTITPFGNVAVQPFSPFAPSAAYSTSVNGGSGYFDGTGDYLTAPKNAAYDFGTGDFTIEAWVYFTAVGTIVSNTDNGNLTSGGFYIAEDGTFLVGTSGGSFATIGTFTYPTNQWFHIAVTRSGTTAKGFINGVESFSATNSTNIATSGTNLLAIGSRRTGVSGVGSYGGFTTGYISSLRIVKGTAVYTSAFTPPTAPLTAIANTSFLCNFTNAGIFDNTGKNNLETVADAQIDTTTKKYGTGSMEFDGTGDWLLLANNVNQQLGTGNFTIEFWVYLASGDTGSNRGLVAKGTSTTGFLVSLNTTEKVVFTYATSTITSSGAITTNAWNHIAVVREGTGSNQTKIYIAGTNDGTGTVSTDFNQTSVMYVGANRTGGDPMKGFIDDLRITKGVARYTANFTPPDKAFPDL